MSVVPRPSVRRDAKGFVEYLDESGEWIHLNTFAAYQAVNAALAEQCVIKICPNAEREKIKEALSVHSGRAASKSFMRNRRSLWTVHITVKVCMRFVSR